MQIEIIQILILKDRLGCDHIVLQTTMPCPYIPESGLTARLELDFKCSADHGEAYVAENFPGIPVKVIQV